MDALGLNDAEKWLKKLAGDRYVEPEALHEDGWLSGSKACNRDDPEIDKGHKLDADSQLFKSAHAAMTFAFNYQGLPALSATNRMGQEPSKVSGKGLSGVGGAAQAGIIRSKLSALGRLHEQILIADIAPRSYPCPCRSYCCSGHTRNQEWVDAVSWLSDIVRVEALDGHKTTHPVRLACVEVFFGAKRPVAKIANDLDLSESTASTLIKKVRRYLSVEQDRARIEADNALDYLVIK